MNFIDNDLLSIQEARILAENAYQIQPDLAQFSQEKLDSIVEAMADAVEPHIQELAILSASETDFGNWRDKYAKNQFVCGYLREQLRGQRFVGVISEDSAKGMVDIGVPMGVIAALCPATSPVSTTIYKALIAVKSGNAIIFSPHPRARNTIGKVLDIMIEAAENAGLPEGALTYLHTVAESGTIELMNHENVSMIINTGVPGMLKAAQDSHKPLIYGGAGNGPVFIERTADIPQAVKDIISSKTFDYGLLPAAEQSIVVDGAIADQVKAEFMKNHVWFMSGEESRQLARIMFEPDGSANKELVGIRADKLAKKAGFKVPEGTVLLISEEKFASHQNPYTREKLGPVMAYFIEDDWMHACEKCIELLLTERQGHTLVIHSKSEDVIREFALKKPVGRVLVNTPATFGSMGATTNLFPAMTLGSGTAGYGITSDNVSPKNLIYVRKVGFGMRDMQTVDRDMFRRSSLPEQPEITVEDMHHAEEVKTVQEVLRNIINDIEGLNDK